MAHYKTLCGCISFNEAEYNFGLPGIKVKMHYRAHPECKGGARATWIWQQREPIGDKREIDDEHDTAYDEPVQGS